MSRNAKANFVIGEGEGRGVGVGEDDCIIFKTLYILQKIRSSGNLCFQMCGLLASNPLTGFTASRTVPEILSSY